MKASITSMKCQGTSPFYSMKTFKRTNKQTKEIFVGIVSFYRKLGILGSFPVSSEWIKKFLLFS